MSRRISLLLFRETFCTMNSRVKISVVQIFSLYPANIKTDGGYTDSFYDKLRWSWAELRSPDSMSVLVVCKRITPRSVVYTKSYVRQRTNELQNLHFDIGALEYILQR